MKIDVTAKAISLDKAPKAATEDSKLRQACRDFEAVLINQMLSKMRSTVPKSDLFGSSEKEELFQGMLDEEIAKEISRNGTMKVADLLYVQLSKQLKTR